MSEDRPIDERLFCAMARGREYTAGDLAARTGIDDADVQTHLRRMANARMIQCEIFEGTRLYRRKTEVRANSKTGAA